MLRGGHPRNPGTRALIRHYVWMGDTPVAVIVGGRIYYVRTDWIGRPVFATTSAGTVVWTTARGSARSTVRTLHWSVFRALLTPRPVAPDG